MHDSCFFLDVQEFPSLSECLKVLYATPMELSGD
jgi:hypothetical protein